jgi:anti-anti-sigma factor
MTRINNINLITAYGECDFCSVKLLKDVITEVIDSGNKKLIVEVGRLKHHDDSVLAVMLWARHKMAEIGGKMVVVGLNCGKMKNAIGDLINMATSIKEAMYTLNGKEGLGYM